MKMPKKKTPVTQEEVNKIVALVEKRVREEKDLAKENPNSTTLSHAELFEVLAKEDINRIRWEIQPDYFADMEIDSTYGSEGYFFTLPASFDFNTDCPESPEPSTKKKKSKETKTFTEFKFRYICPPIFRDVLDAIQIGMQPYISGPPGSGKSRLYEEIALMTGQKCIRQSLSVVTDPDYIIGSMLISEQDGVPVSTFIDGILTQAVREGWFLIFDELDRMSPQANMMFQQISEDGGHLVIYTENGPVSIKKHPDFRMAFTGNTNCHGDETNLFPGAEEQDAALLSRIGPKFELPYCPEVEEQVITPLLPTQVTKALYDDSTSPNKRGIIRLIREACSDHTGGNINYQLSFRFILRFAECYRIYGWNKCALYCLVNEFPDIFRGRVRDIITQRLGPEFEPTNDAEFIKANQKFLIENGYAGKVTT